MAVGGAIRSRGRLNIANVAISGNRAGFAGAILVESGEFVLTDSEVRSNSLTGMGGGIVIPAGVPSPTTGPITATIARSSIRGNSADGAILIISKGDQPVTIRNSDFTDNFGEISIGGPGPVTIADTTITGNSGVFLDVIRQCCSNSGNITVTNSTIVNNQSGVRGAGGIRILNSIVASNKGFFARGSDCGGQVISLGHNLFGDPSNCGAVAGDLIGDAALGTLVDAGRPGGRYVPLLATSRAIDAGNSAECPTSDQRGLARGVDGNSDGVQGCDIGAVEFYPVVNDRVQLEGLQDLFVKPSNLGFTDPRASAGAFRITALFRNVGPDICNVAFGVPTFDGPAGTNPVILTPAREFLGGQGAGVTAEKAGAQPHLLSGGLGSYQFTIGVQQRTPVNFFVDALGDATSGPCNP